MTSHPEFNKKTTSEEVVEAFADVIKDKTIVITGVGPNSLGEAMAKTLATKSPANLILTARTISKAEAVAADIKAHLPSANIQLLQQDLSSVKSVRQSAAKLLEMVDSIDILINNAGVMALPERTLSEDGYEMHFATNFLGHFLFTNLILSKFNPGARIVNVTTGGYMVCPIRFHDLAWENKDLPPEEEPNMVLAEQLGVGSLTRAGEYSPMLAYLHTSTAIMLFSVGLKMRFHDKKITGISAAPGVILTGIQRHVGGFINELAEYKNASQGAASFLVAALDPALQDHSGAYVDDCQVVEITAEHAKSEEVADHLWNVASQMVGI
ncbi:hypothetical protein F5884DRAFT_249903 [Xylogone sp. PMI_703]|nr:hypothetical protein F5884DRAFT_249903 [Xylogone sp. PMI_703]